MPYTIVYLRPPNGILAADFVPESLPDGARLVELLLDDPSAPSPALSSALAQADAVIYQFSPPPAAFFLQSPRCGIVIHAGPGAAGLDPAPLRDLGIFLASIPEAGADEFAWASLDAAARLMRNSPPPAHRKARLGILGLGAVGQSAAARAIALGWETTVFDPFADEEIFRRSGARRAPDAVSIFGRSDAVIVALPAINETFGVINRDLLGLLPRPASFVNLCDPRLADESALLDALDSGRIARAALSAPPEAAPRARALIASGRLAIQRCDPASDQAVRLKSLRRAAEIALAAFDGAVPPHLLIDPPMPRLLTRSPAAA